MSIDLYHTNGQFIRQLVPLQTLSVGNHQVHFDVQGLPAGTYFCRIKTKEGSKNLKLLITN